MALEKYRAKRSFNVTAEPRGGKIKRGGDAFVIQKHAATRLHYDLRLELDGVMKSWAVTRGPSLVPGDKRLAVHVEDHPVEYNSFEGTIPKDQYGGGTVMIWDRGRWIPDGDPHRGYAKGKLDFALDGHKLQGHWHLVRMRKRPGERQEPWLLIKAKDEAARGPNDPDILEEKDRSVVSRRTIEGIEKAGGAVWQSNRSVSDNVETMKAAGKTAKKAKAAPRKKASKKAAPRGKAKRTKSRAQVAAADVRREKPKRKSKGDPLPAFVQPQLAELHDTAPDNPAYVHEAKFDGYRLQARVDHGEIQLLTRKALNWADKFKPVANALVEASHRHRADRRRGRGREERRERFLVAAGCAEEQERQLCLLRVRSPASRRHRLDRRAADRTQGRTEAIGEERGRRRHHPLQRSLRDPRLRDDAACRQARSGGRHLQAARCALPFRPQRRLDQGEGPRQPGVCDRRLQGCDAPEGRDRRARARLLQGRQAHLRGPLRHRLHGASRARSVEAASAVAPRHARLRQASRGGARPQGDLGRAEARCRGRVRRLYRAGPRPPRGVQGPSRGQARERSRAGDADADEIESQEVERNRRSAARKDPRPRTKRRSSSPTPTASTGPTPRSPSSSSRTTTPRCGITSHRIW